MGTATEAFHNRLAVIFDFDDTLAPSSYDTLLESCGFDPDTFRKERVQPLSAQGWDDTLARFYCLIEASRSRDEPITKAHLEQVGRGLKPFDGVPEMFDRVRRCAREVVDDIEVEFYLLTCGFVDVQRATPIAREFEQMWGSEFYFDEDGGIAFAKQTINFPEKVQYVLALSKGVSTDGANSPTEAYRSVDPADYHVPLDQVIYVGDGGSDLPTFSLLNDHGGRAIGIYKDSAAQWRKKNEIYPGGQVQNLAKADYSENSELMQSLMLCTESICKLIALRKLSRGE